MAPKVDMKRSMTSHRTWVNDAIKRAEKFIGDNPDGLTSGDQEKTISKVNAEYSIYPLQKFRITQFDEISGYTLHNLTKFCITQFDEISRYTFCYTI